mmetsp:Transcript_25877/g.56375  ORF Transcript_25877/g.56375 Transcript_25877/m.56375 type:complete len:326 (-) Transcript_25877:128-1105(-)
MALNAPQLPSSSHSTPQLPSSSQTAHHGTELCIVDAAVAVLVHLADDVLHVSVIDVHLAQRLHELVVRDAAVMVKVKVRKRRLEAVLPLQLGLVDGGSQELLVVNGACAARVSTRHQLLQLLIRQLQAFALQCASKLLDRDAARSINVNHPEHLAHVLDLIGWQAAGNDLECLLLEFVHGAEAPDAGQHLPLDLTLPRTAVLTQPLVLQDLGSSGTLVGVPRQHTPHAVLGLIRDAGPGLCLQVWGPGAHRPEGLLLVVPLEGRVAGHQDVEQHTTCPDVSLLAVRAADHLGGYVIGDSDDVGQHLALLEKGGAAKASNLDDRIV